MHRKLKSNVLWAAAGLLLCLLAFSQLSDSIPTALSITSQPRTLNSLGSIRYLSGTWLAWTDFENLPVGTTFSDGQDADGIWQQGNIGASWMFDSPGSASISSTRAVSGTRSVRNVKAGTGGRTTLYYGTGSWKSELYTSAWFYIPSSNVYEWGWEFWEIFELSSNAYSYWRDGACLCMMLFGGNSGQTLGSTKDSLYWDFGYEHHTGGADIPGTFRYQIYKTYWDGWSGGIVRDKNGNQIGSLVGPTATNVVVTPHEVPLDRWFRFEIYVYRSRSNGIISIWLTDSGTTVTLLHAETIWTSYDVDVSGALQQNVPMKMYGTYGEMWVDDLYIANYNAHK